jgi:hypothetical protein
MADAIVIDLSGGLDWVAFQMPGGTMPVRLALLRTDARGGPTSLVRFPAGFRRPDAGRYEVAEEFVVLEGSLSMTGTTYSAPRWVYVPAEATRADTVAEAEVLALARFDGKARWHTGPATNATPNDDALERTFDAVSPFGRARLLRRAPGESTWFVARAEPGPAPVTLELLDPAARIWAWVPAGEEIPDVPGPCIVRTVEEDP